jgi:hypothetical protein
VAAAVRGLPLPVVTDWFADKSRYRLSVDPIEEAALSEALSRCPNEPITVTLAR